MPGLLRMRSQLLRHQPCSCCAELQAVGCARPWPSIVWGGEATGLTVPMGHSEAGVLRWGSTQDEGERVRSEVYSQAIHCNC